MGWFSSIRNVAQEAASSVIDDASNQVSGVAREYGGDFIGDIVDPYVESASDYANSVVDSVLDEVEKVADSVEKAVRNASESAVGTLVGSVEDAFDSVYDSINESSSEVLSAISNEINGKTNALLDAIGSFKIEAPFDITKNPFLVDSFTVEIDGIQNLQFFEMSEIKSTTSVMEFKEGGRNEILKFPEFTEFSNITLKNGYGAIDALYYWRNLVLLGNMEDARKDIIITYYTKKDANGSEGFTKKWKCKGAWICSLSIGEMNRKESNLVVESVEFVVEKCECLSC